MNRIVRPKNMYMRCIDNAWCADHLIEGKIYQVVEIVYGEFDVYYKVKGEDGMGTFFSDRFEAPQKPKKSS